MLSLLAVYAVLVLCWTLAARLVRRREEPSPEAVAGDGCPAEGLVGPEAPARDLAPWPPTDAVPRSVSPRG